SPAGLRLPDRRIGAPPHAAGRCSFRVFVIALVFFALLALLIALHLDVDIVILIGSGKLEPGRIVLFATGALEARLDTSGLASDIRLAGAEGFVLRLELAQHAPALEEGVHQAPQ